MRIVITIVSAAEVVVDSEKGEAHARLAKGGRWNWLDPDGRALYPVSPTVHSAIEREIREKYGGRPCPDCYACDECHLIVHDDRPRNHAPTCSMREVGAS